MIRRATTNDAISIYNLERLCFASPYPLDTIVSDLNNEKMLFLVFEKNNEIIGYISVFYFLEEANLQKICVLERERKKGVARDLINNAVEILKINNVKSFYLEVNEHNNIAIEVYKKLGFNQISTRKNYYGADSAIIFQKNL